ncbi:MAG: hypothetical protein WCR27_08785 [Eubacteriales bacterium]
MVIVHKIVMFCSSYIPLFLLMLIKNFFERIFPDDKNLISWEQVLNMQLFNELNDFWVAIIFCLICFSFYYLRKIIKETERANPIDYTLCKVENKSSEYFMNYIALYLLPCVGLSLNKITDVAVFFVVMCIVGYIYIECNLIYMNPILNMMGYQIYFAKVHDSNTNNSSSVFESIIIAHKSLNIECGKIYKGTIKNQFIFMRKVVPHKNI